jgi:CubicO group peptidase (beta-lactamase class C family)
MTTIEGYCDPGFAPVREAFAENFAQRGEIGAAVAVTPAGRMVVDLWGGSADSARLGPNAASFGHAGAGGSIGMADPAAGVSIGYVVNRMGSGVLLNARDQSLIDAVYASRV